MKSWGIDVSEHQGTINWQRVKAYGIKYAILRVGYGDNIKSQDDKFFIRNADECTRYSIPFGVYIYSYAQSRGQARSEAEHVLRLIDGYELSYPVYFDMEDERTQGRLSRSELAGIAGDFCEIIESKGYITGVYANLNWWNNRLVDSVYDQYEKWVAQYNPNISESDYKKDHGMWQYSSVGYVDGISGNVDMNYCYVDYEALTSKNDVDKLVVYYGDIDVASAAILSQNNSCPMMRMGDYITSEIKAGEIMMVGGNPNDPNRFQTAKNVADKLK